MIRCTLIFALIFALNIVSVSNVTQAGIRFEKTVLNDTFYSEGCAVADFNKDGKKDLLAGPFWYEAPNWKKHEIREPGNFAFDKGYSQSFINGAMDVNNDGWDDALIVGYPGDPGWWYENPKGAGGDWKKHAIAQSVCNESPHVIDYDGDGRKDMVFPSNTDGRWAWFEAPKGEGATEWTRHLISKGPEGDKLVPGTYKYAHGMGIADLNQDGRNDLLVAEGWWEGPEDPTSPEWEFHPAPFGEACAHMYVYDFDKDGDMDVVSSSAHNYGVWWHEQGKNEAGETTWTTHLIYNSVSQTHSLCFKDMNADGLPDLITGKRFFAHNGRDPGGHHPAFLYWFEYRLEETGPVWIPHQIDDDSGIGTNFQVEDLNGDGKPDIAISNKKGTFVFLQVAD